MGLTIGKNKIYRMRIEDDFDPERPVWATPQGSRIFLYDHPVTYAGFLARYFYTNTVDIGEEIPAWTYDTISNHGLDSSTWSAEFNVMPPNSGPVPNTLGVYDGQQVLRDGPLVGFNQADVDVLRFWPVGRPSADGGLIPHWISSKNADGVSTDYYPATGPEVIAQ
jgi:hypothetical protein